MASLTDVRRLLATTTLVPDTVDSLLTTAAARWCAHMPADLAAADLALCHPPLRRGEVRVLVRSTSHWGTWRVTVAASGSATPVAGAAGALAESGLEVARTSVVSWPDRDLTLQSLVAVAPVGAVPTGGWEEVGDRLRAALGRDAGPEPATGRLAPAESRPAKGTSHG